MAEILHQTTDCLPGMYVFDVVTTNFGALERVSRTSYRLVCVAEDASSALDGRSAANILRQVSQPQYLVAQITVNGPGCARA